MTITDIANSAPTYRAHLRDERSLRYDEIAAACRTLMAKGYDTKAALNYLVKVAAVTVEDETHWRRVYRAVCYRINGRGPEKKGGSA